VAGTWLNNWGIGYLPLRHLGLTVAERSFAYRGASTFMTVALIYFFAPNALRSLAPWVKRGRGLSSLYIVVFVIGSSGALHVIAHHSLYQLFLATLWALSIGIEEDTFARGFSFGVLSKYGIWFAATISSIEFGALHLMNILSGYSWAYTSGQAVSAAAFGFLCCGLMIYSGTIWLPILFHAATDLPMSLQSSAAFTKDVTGGTQWFFVLIQSAIYIGIGAALIWADKRDLSNFQDLVEQINPSLPAKSQADPSPLGLKGHQQE
jgi:membrane protease YdiL (CAAX protease family)